MSDEEDLREALYAPKDGCLAFANDILKKHYLIEKRRRVDCEVQLGQWEDGYNRFLGIESENATLRKEVDRLKSAHCECSGCVQERDSLRRQVEEQAGKLADMKRLMNQDSQEMRRLCEARDKAEKERDEWKAAASGRTVSCVCANPTPPESEARPSGGNHGL